MKKIIALFVVWLMLFGFFPNMSAYSSEDHRANRYNVMMVIDGSGSLSTTNGTDVQGYRYNAIRLFLGVLTNEGNKVGAIVFNDKEQKPLDTGLIDLPTLADKKTMADKIEQTGANGDTDIGGALLRGLEELEGPEADSSLPKCIVLFSDGETDMGNAQATQASLVKKDLAIQEAVKAGIPIHGICLNTNNSANTQEVKGIAESTGGFYQEIKDATDLDEAFLKFYSLIYGENILSGSEEECPVEKNFKIPSKGVVEVNALMECNNPNRVITLTRPDGTSYTQAELDAAMISTGQRDVIKIVNPQAGIWKLVVDGAPGAKVTFDWIYNTDLSAEIECDVTDAKLNTDIEIHGYLLINGERTDNVEVYNEYSGTLKLKNITTEEINNYPMQSDGTRFVSNVKFPEFGTYEASIELACGDIIHDSASTTINVGNEAPIVEENINKKITRFLPGEAKVELNLDDYASDPEGESLTYTLGQCSYDMDSVVLEGSKLSVKTGHNKNGVVNIIATDNAGATAQFQININVKNLFWILPVILIAIALIILIARLTRKPPIYYGTITVHSFDYVNDIYSNPYPQTGIKDRRNLKDWQIMDCGVQGDFVVKKNGKNTDLYFVSKQPFETELGQIVKEYKLVAGDDIRLFAVGTTEDERMQRGINIIVSDNI